MSELTVGKGSTLFSGKKLDVDISKFLNDRAMGLPPNRVKCARHVPIQIPVPVFTRFPEDVGQTDG